MYKWEEKYAKWRGTAAELADVAQEVIGLVGMKDPTIQPNERLIRHYVQMGVLSKPVRKGRESLFDFRQLAQYLVARNLALDGWPLAKISEFTGMSTLSGLLDLIPKPSQSHKTRPFPDIQEMAGVKTSDRQPASTQHKQVIKTANIQCTRQVLEIELLPWCKIYIDQKMTQHLESREAEQIGKKLTQILNQIVGQ